MSSEPTPNEEIQDQESTTTTDKFTNFLEFFKPKQGYFFTPLLVILNILIFILMVIKGVDIFLPNNEDLISWGANFRPLTLGGEWWRIITSCFLHIGIIHLAFNMYALIYIGVLLEPRLGATRYISAYLLAGIASSVASLWWHDDLTISAGASGAIFGMYGLFLAMLTTSLIEKSARKDLLASIGVFVGYNLLYGLKGQVDNAAHIGGLLAGIVIGYAYLPSLKKPGDVKLKYTTIGLLTLLILAASYFGYTKTPNDIAQYEEKMNQFASLEEKALEFYRLPENTSKDVLLTELKDNGIPYWNENIKLLTELEKLDLPPAIQEKNRKLLDYCDLRIKSYNLAYKSIEQDTQEYNDSLQIYNEKIVKIIEGLKE